ncbi:hypothetical protein AVEN_119069-1 [Araneus ventricosus]|uniref:Uncharacterized protein n=1 Tax=Araneus ventricosus TaxID=182803 RepID=A0A4Y2BKT3_ARAVE|nr:hypothetical protein AVEN_119069-1 [Araneus ventricosus]
MAGDTLAQASVIRFQSSFTVGGGVAYTRCLMFPHRKKVQWVQDRGSSAYGIPIPRSSAKQDFKQRALAKWQRRWDDSINGRSTYEVIKKVGLLNHYWPRQLIQFVTGYGHFPSYRFRFGKHPDNCCACGEPGTPLHYTTKCRLTLSYHLRCPADQYIEDLLNFITRQEDLIKSEQPEYSTIACIVHPTTKLMSPTTPFFSFLLEHSMTERDNQFQCLRPQPHVLALSVQFHAYPPNRQGAASVPSSGKYREDSSTFEIPYFVAKVAKFVAKWPKWSPSLSPRSGEPDVADASHPILIPVKLSSQP